MVTAVDVFRRYAAAVAYIAVIDAEGNHGIGTAFHVGQGVFVTARHVVEGHTIHRIATVHSFHAHLSEECAERGRTPFREVDGDTQAVRNIAAQEYRILAGPFFHMDSSIDVAVFRVTDADRELPWIPLGGHLDDWIAPTDFVLSEALVMGFPPIPMTNEPTLVAARAQVNAVIDPRHAPSVHFVLSAMARGGFSGGPALIDGYLLGLVTESLMRNGQPAELGYFTVISVEPIFNCLHKHKLLPHAQIADFGTSIWDDGLLPSP